MGNDIRICILVKQKTDYQFVLPYIQTDWSEDRIRPYQEASLPSRGGFWQSDPVSCPCPPRRQSHLKIIRVHSSTFLCRGRGQLTALGCHNLGISHHWLVLSDSYWVTWIKSLVKKVLERQRENNRLRETTNANRRAHTSELHKISKQACKYSIMASLTARATRTPMFRASISSRQPLSRSLTTRAISYKLNTGAKIPQLGSEYFKIPSLRERLSARVYDVEKEVGKGIKKSWVPREDIFLGKKLWCDDYHPDDVERALDDSLRDLDTPYVDLLLVHYPCTPNADRIGFLGMPMAEWFWVKRHMWKLGEQWKNWPALAKRKLLEYQILARTKLKLSSERLLRLVILPDTIIRQADWLLGPGCPSNGSSSLSTTKRF